ncbi:MAG: hypothetical protein ACFCU7_19870 [Pleurocapsa sp.]
MIIIINNTSLSEISLTDSCAEPDLSPPDRDPEKQFTRANHLSFDISPQLFDDLVIGDRQYHSSRTNSHRPIWR